MFSNNNPYGGEKVGTFSITPEGHVIHLLANMSAAPSSEKYMKDGLLTLAVQGINSV